MRDCKVQGAGVPEGAVYKEVVVIGTFFILKRLIITSEIASNLICVWVVCSSKVSSLRAVKVWKYSSTLVYKSQQDAQVTEFIFV